MYIHVFRLIVFCDMLKCIFFVNTCMFINYSYVKVLLYQCINKKKVQKPINNFIIQYNKVYDPRKFCLDNLCFYLKSKDIFLSTRLFTRLLLAY